MMKSKLKFLTLILSILVMICSSSVSVVHAETTEYADVFDDLRADESFSAEDYQSMTHQEASDMGQPFLEVIQIAESTAKELYIYVYNPLCDETEITATAISMSCDYSSNGQNLKPIIYDLELVSRYRTFDKYVVKDFVVSDEVYRYYNIVSIYRPFNGLLDTISESGSEPTEIGISVGQQWCTYYFNDELVYEMGTFETLEINVDYTGNFEFSSGITWGNLLGAYNWGTSWFIAFSCDDYKIKHIYDADLSYKIRDMSRSIGLGLSGEWTYGEWSDDKYVYLSDSDSVSYDGGGLFSKEYTWNRIMSSQDFITNAENQEVTISDECKTALQNSQWVFAFAETEISMISGQYATTTFQSDISDVTILRIHFVDINNKIYNLGVVSDRVNPDNNSDGYGGLDADAMEDFFEKILMLVGIIALFAILGFCGPILGAVLNILLSVLKLVFKGVFTIISLPFKLIGKLLKPKNKKP